MPVIGGRSGPLESLQSSFPLRRWDRFGNLNRPDDKVARLPVDGRVLFLQPCHPKDDIVLANRRNIGLLESHLDCPIPEVFQNHIMSDPSLRVLRFVGVPEDNRSSEGDKCHAGSFCQGGGNQTLH